ncbi:hypothetical protein [Sinorhizobium saheli]|uniref:TnsA endonuclease N-terminal domain-containing protein n=1 Tax=Sinorhizobium saheli TaxID=36856 RepID=A0A178YLN6_SINSA|nr:hypothetical protein [Sinorhizobium saheli]MQW88332.1 hypothetical protein [Sinorhizobium saheli]OAP48439.1 hypothetical protein ATB98_24110 [Sinorhizobium saheli]
MTTFTAHAAGDEACDLPDFYNSRFPSATLKCLGRTLYRSQEASDYACLLELDPDVISWRCITQPFVNHSPARKPRHRYVDFAVQKGDETLLVDIWRGTPEIITWLPGVAERLGYTYHPISIFDLNPTRIQNARDLVRYGGREAALGDRIRILAGLDEMGSLTLAECLGAVRDGAPMGSVANLILRGMLEVDLDEKLLDPDTIVRRARS